MHSLASFFSLYRYRMLFIQATGKILPVQAVLNSSQPCQKKLSDSWSHHSLVTGWSLKIISFFSLFLVAERFKAFDFFFFVLQKGLAQVLGGTMKLFSYCWCAGCPKCRWRDPWGEPILSSGPSWRLFLREAGLVPGVPRWLFVFSLLKWVHTNLDL